MPRNLLLESLHHRSTPPAPKGLPEVIPLHPEDRPVGRVASAASVPSLVEEREQRRSRVSEGEKSGSMRPTNLRELEDRKAEQLRTGI